MTNRFTSLFMIAALSLNHLPFSKQATVQLSDASHNEAFNQQQTSQNPQERAKQDQPIRLKTELIDMRAVVTDKRGQPITDLKQEDFELMENGKPQELSFFSAVKIPGRGEAGQPAAPSAVTPSGVPAGGTRTAETIGRSVLLYVDTLHLSFQSLVTVRQALRKFIDERLTDQDLAAIVTSAGSLGVVEQFTLDHKVLRHAVDRLGAWPSDRNSLFTPYIAGMVERGDGEALQVATAIYVAEHPIERPSAIWIKSWARKVLSEADYTRRATLIKLREVVQRLSDLPGQRLLVMVSDGFTLYDTGGGMDMDDLQSITSRAVRSGVVIYSIDAKGLQPSPLFDVHFNLGFDPRISRYVDSSERDQENVLNALAKDTGGEAIFNTNDTAGAMGQALDDNQVYYRLAYYPEITESDWKFRKITIRIKNHPEYQVRAQRGYIPADLAKKTKEEEAKTPQQRFVNAILAPLAVTDIGVTATASFIEAPEDNAQVSLHMHIDGETLTYREENGKYHFEAEILTMIYNSDGKRVDLKSENLQGDLTPERLEVAKQNGFQYDRRVQLKPGLYQIRAGVTEPANARTGTTTAWIETPDLSKKNKLALSSLFLTDAMPTGIQEPASNNGHGEEPSPSRLLQGIRYYKSGQPIVYLFRLYNALNDKAETDATMQIEIMQDEKPILTTPWQPAATLQLKKDAKGLVIGGQLGLRNVKPGIYDLRVSVKDPKMKRPVQISVSFGIEN